MGVGDKLRGGRLLILMAGWSLWQRERVLSCLLWARALRSHQRKGDPESRFLL